MFNISSLLSIFSAFPSVALSNANGRRSLVADFKDGSPISENINVTEHWNSFGRKYFSCDFPDSLRFGRGDFELEFEIEWPENPTSEPGTIFSNYSAETETGIVVDAVSNASGYSGQGDDFSVFAGMNKAKSHPIEKHGRPGKGSVYCGTLCSYKGRLYAGSSADIYSATECGVYYLADNEEWNLDYLFPETSMNQSVTDMIVHKGKLHAVTKVYMRALKLKELELGVEATAPATVWRREEDGSWISLGSPTGGYRIWGGLSYNGDLFFLCEHPELTGHPPVSLMKHTEEGWEDVAFSETMVTSLVRASGQIYIGSSPEGKVFQWEPETMDLKDLGNPFGSKKDATQIHKMGAFEGFPTAGAWVSGKFGGFSKKESSEFIIWGQVPECTEINEMISYLGHYYIGAFPWAEIYKTDLSGRMEKMARFRSPDLGFVENKDTVPDWTVEADRARLTAMTIHNGRLFAAVGSLYGGHSWLAHSDTRGQVFSLKEGYTIQSEQLPAGRSVVSIRKTNGKFELLINGSLVDTTEIENSFTPENNAPILIGNGPSGVFAGRIGKVTINVVDEL